MYRKIGVFIMINIYLYLLICPFTALSADQSLPYIKTLNIVTIDNRPLYIDRLVYTALLDIGYKSSHITAASLPIGFQLADEGERDGVVAYIPNLEQTYPNLMRVPVVLDYNNCNVYIRSDSNIKINEWSDLSGLRVGMLTGRAYIENQTPDDAVKISKDATNLVYDGLLEGQYDVVVLPQRDHEYVSLPDGVILYSTIDTLPEYLYLHKKHESLIPDLTKALEQIFSDGRSEKIYEGMPIYEADSKKTILHLISANTEITREDEFSRTVREYFMEDTSIEWYSVALNSKRFSDDPQRLSYFANLLRRDCVSKNIAAIVVSGDEAVEFLKDYYYLLFKNIPVLFYGLNDDYKTIIQGYEQYFSGIVENLSAYETVLTALKLFPQTQTIYVMNDHTTEGMNYRSAIEKQLEPLAENLNIIYNDNITRDTLLLQLRELPSDSIVLTGSYFCDADGQYYPLNEMKRIMEHDGFVPVFSLYSTDLAYGSIGGKCLDYERYGTAAAKMLERLLEGESISDIPIITDSKGYNQWVFDKYEMDEWGIKKSFLPENTLIINASPGIWESNPAFAFGMLFFVTASIVIITILFIFSKKLRKNNSELLETRKHLRAAAMAAEDASRTKTTFLANMSHEIRTPMNSIIGFTELALDSGTKDKVKDDYLKKIKENSNILLNIINDILDVSKIEAGKMLLESIPFNMHDVFSACRTVIWPRVQEKGISLYCYTEPSVGKKLLGDPARLRQILINLLSNAVKFTNTGIVKLLGAIEDISNDSVTMRFEVKDSGIGMSQEQLTRIFEPFMQADAGTTRQYGGTGLGLSITKNMIEMMGGKLIAESALGVGSRFSFVLTFKTIDSLDKTSQQIIVRDNLEKPTFKGDVLVCEDNAMNQQVIREHLQRVGLDVVIANNGREGIKHVLSRMGKGEQPFDLIFMDIHMPVMDGLEAVNELKRIGNKTPVVALTANIMSGDEKTYESHGMSDYLSKPFTTQELWKCLVKYITPVSTEAIRQDEYDKADAKRHRRLLTDFARDYQFIFKDINNAIDSGDLKLAHRLAHTLKGLAGLMGKDSLYDAARVIEKALENGKTEYTSEQMDILESELDIVFDELMPLLHESTWQESHIGIDIGNLDKNKTADLFNRLEPLLQSDSVSCLELVDELRAVPGTDALISQMEDYEYELALKTLFLVRQALELQ